MSAPVGDLLSAIRDVASGALRRPALDNEVIEAASARLLTDDLPIAAMLLSGTPVGEIATVVDMSVTDVRRRALRIIGRLQAGNGRRAVPRVPGTTLLTAPQQTARCLPDTPVGPPDAENSTPDALANGLYAGSRRHNQNDWCDLEVEAGVSREQVLRHRERRP
jgi:hypothetical protein